MSMSKSTSLASGANMCSSVGQSRPCRCTVWSMASDRGSVRRMSAFSRGASMVSSPKRQNSSCTAVSRP